MAIGAILGAAGSVAGSIGSGLAKNSAANASAEMQAYIEGLNREFQAGLFNSNQAMSQPYLDFGYQGVEGLGQGGDYDFRSTPEYQYRQGLGNQSLANMQGLSPDVANYASSFMPQSLDTQEQGNAYNRLMDRVRVGQGQAGQAGSQAMAYGTALSNSMQNAGNMSLGAQRYTDQNTSNMINTGLGQASSIPAYMRYANYRSGLTQDEQNRADYGGR